MAKSKCRHCLQRKETSEGIKTPVGFFCDYDHATKFGNANKEKGRKKLEAKRKADKLISDKQKRKEFNQRKKELKPRKYWMDKLQDLVNQYVTKVRDFGKPCCTCGQSSNTVKMDAGHFLTRAARPDLSLELTNIHIQCSVKCNQHGSGMRHEYTEFIRAKYGDDHLNWLLDRSKHQDLKEKYPHWSDIEKEIVRYRELLRGNGVTPCA